MMSEQDDATSIEIADLLLGSGAAALRPRDQFKYPGGVRSPLRLDGDLLAAAAEARGRVVQLMAIVDSYRRNHRAARSYAKPPARGGWVRQPLPGGFVC